MSLLHHWGGAIVTELLSLLILSFSVAALWYRHCQNKILERGSAVAWHRGTTHRSLFRYFKTSPEIILLAEMM